MCLVADMRHSAVFNAAKGNTQFLKVHPPAHLDWCRNCLESNLMLIPPNEGHLKDSLQGNRLVFLFLLSHMKVPTLTSYVLDISNYIDPSVTSKENVTLLLTLCSVYTFTHSEEKLNAE